MIRVQILHDALDLVYPPCCAVCGDCDTLPRDAFCNKCSIALRNLCVAPSCPFCALPLGEGGACPHCQGKSLHPFERIVALGPFRDPLRKLIHQMKYHHRWPVAEILADRLLQQDRVRQMLGQTDCLAAVPLHWSRQIARGYNQAAAVAKQLSRRTKIKIVRPVVRLKDTETQASIQSKAIRAENLRFAFGLIRPKSIRNKRVTIVDDVMTTASTLKSVARAIAEGEPASISAIVLAVADPRHQDFQAV